MLPVDKTVYLSLSMVCSVPAPYMWATAPLISQGHQPVSQEQPESLWAPPATPLPVSRSAGPLPSNGFCNCHALVPDHPVPHALASQPYFLCPLSINLPENLREHEHLSQQEVEESSANLQEL